MSLSTIFLGLNLKNPIIVAAGPWSRDAQSIQRSIDAGAGAVVTETITLETGINIRPRLFKNNAHLFNVMLYSALSLEQWEYELEQVDKKDSFIICSIWGSSPSELSYIAAKVERMGADAIEISISAPIGTKSDRLTYYPDYIEEYVKSVVNIVDIPVMVKLSYNTSLYSKVIRSIENAGAIAISAIDSLKSLQGVNIETQESIMPTYGGYTGEHIRPISLATTATLAQLTKCQLSGIGGIFYYKNVLEYIMLGSTTVQLASAIQLGGYHVITETISDLNQWLEKQSYNSINNLRGSALKSLEAYEDIPVENLIAQVRSSCTSKNILNAHSACIYNAIEVVSGKPKISPNLCTGCGLCVEICPECFELVWKQVKKTNPL
jgi:dihydroorotate dehydrogenase (fumarate)